MMMLLDEEGRDFIKRFEALSLTPYQDKGGTWTIGWGHTDGVNSNTPAISKMQADQMFDIDVEDAEVAVNRMVLIEMVQCEFNALVSLEYNVGCGALRRSDLVRILNSGNRIGASKHFLLFNKCRDKVSGALIPDEGLSKRRELERQMFLKNFNRVREDIEEL